MLFVAQLVEGCLLSMWGHLQGPPFDHSLYISTLRDPVLHLYAQLKEADFVEAADWTTRWGASYWFLEGNMEI